MAVTPDFMLGIDAKIYYTATPGSALSTFTLILDRVQDVSLKITTSDADITTRANSGWKATAPTLKEAEVSFGMVAKPGDAGYTALRTAWLANSVIGLAVLTGAKAATGVEGPVGDWSITEFSRDETLTEAIKYNITAKLSTFKAWAIDGA